MRVKFNKDYILVVSPAFVKWSGKLTTGTFDAKGAAVFPFIFVRSEEYIQPWLITHERIHFKQQVETLFIGSMLLSVFEWVYARFFLRMDHMERYLYAAVEQEAYLNMYDPTYLERRPVWNLFKYVKQKRLFRLTGPGEMEFLD